MLSEYAVLGYEYGYSLAEPNALMLWEAQFGDFANGAQIMIDQFISSGEAKWLRMSGLVLLLPHGYEGQGPEHSSARPERFLQMCASDNWIVANCTTPANYFHILRRQIHRSFRKPLVLMTPKSLLRHKLAVSKLKDFAKGSSFHRLLWDDADMGPEYGISSTKLVPDDKIKRVVLCSGKVYYDLLEERDARGIDDVYLMRLEQFYPFPALSLTKELGRFKQAQIVWCQEEPKNQGDWTFVEPNLEWVLDRIERQARPPALRRPPGRRLARHRPRPRAQGAAGRRWSTPRSPQEGPLTPWPTSACPRSARASPRPPSPPGSRRSATPSRSTRCSASSRPTRSRSRSRPPPPAS